MINQMVTVPNRIAFLTKHIEFKFAYLVEMKYFMEIVVYVSSLKSNDVKF